jgi:tetratricopeptide (TPR) repeat protein
MSDRPASVADPVRPDVGRSPAESTGSRTRPGEASSQALERSSPSPPHGARTHSSRAEPRQARGAPVASFPELSYQAAFQAAYAGLGRTARRLQETRSAAPRLYRELHGHPPEQRRLLARAGGRFANWGLAELLLAEAEEGWAADPAAAEDAIRLALDVLGSLAAELDFRPLLQDLEARAWSLLARVHLSRADSREAGRALERARQHLVQGSGDPVEEAHLLELEARLDCELGEREAGVVALRRAILAYRRAGEQGDAARALLAQATIFREAGQPARAVRLLLRARDLLKGGDESHLLLGIQRTLVILLHEAGRSEEAAAVLAEARRLALALESRVELLRLRQTERRVLSFPSSPR